MGTMSDNQPQPQGGEEEEEEEEEALNKPQPDSPSFATNSPLRRKRLLADTKPPDKLSSASASASASPQDSALSSSDRSRKKTRELPNLSDCHSCGLRLNHTNPKDRLQTLDSVWRIVLLCKKCIKRVQSAELCPYCFAETSEKDCFRCRRCQRRVHNDCVVKCGGSAPWAYCSSESDLGFSVCIDCWVPKLLANSIRVYRRRRKKISSNSDSLASSLGVSVKSNGRKSLVHVVKDASLAVDKKAEAAAKAKENALRKAVVAKRAMELASNALELVAKKDKDGAKSKCLMTSSSSTSDTTATTVVDDAELAFQLHRAMNSSPRISKNLCSANSSYFAVPKTRQCNGTSLHRLFYSRRNSRTSVGGKLELCTDTKLTEQVDTTLSEPSVHLRAADSGSCIDLGNVKPETMNAWRAGPKGMECQENSEVDMAVGVVGKCSSIDENRIDSDSWYGQELDKSKHKLHQNGGGTQCPLKCQENNTMLNHGSCNGKLDRYLLKYSKRSARSKPVLNSESKFHHDAFDLEDQASSPALLMNCSNESRTLFGAPFQSHAVHMQAFACVSGSSREEPWSNR